MTLEEVKKSKLLCNLDKVAQQYGFQGEFVEISTVGSTKSLFFITGAIDKCEITPERILNSQNLADAYFPIDLKAFNLDKVTITNEFETFFKISTYLDKLSVVCGVYVILGENAPPSTLPTKTVDFICDNYVQWQDMYETNKNSEKAQEFIKKTISNYNHDYNSDIIGNGMDFTKPWLYNKLKSVFSKYPNKVSLKYLYLMSVSKCAVSSSLIRTYKIPNENKKSLQKELSKNQHIFYSVVKGNKLFKRFLVSDEFANEFISLAHKVLFPKAFNENIISVKNFKDDSVLINVPLSNLDIFLDTIIHYNIPYYYAENSLNNNFYIIPIVVSIKDYDVISQILVQLCEKKISDSYFNTRKQEFSTSKYQEKVKKDKQDKYNLAKDILKQNNI